MLESLENKIYESVNKKGIWGLGLIPTTLFLDTKSYIKKENITELGNKIGCYLYAGIFELLKFGTGYLLYRIGEELI
jgi:hypothetical protein